MRHYSVRKKLLLDVLWELKNDTVKGEIGFGRQLHIDMEVEILPSELLIFCKLKVRY